MDERDSNGRFTKGSTGNPKGRPKKKPAPPTPQEVLESATMEAVTRLIHLVHSDNEAVALRASIAVLFLASDKESSSERLEKNLKSIDETLQYIEGSTASLAACTAQNMW